MKNCLRETSKLSLSVGTTARFSRRNYDGDKPMILKTLCSKEIKNFHRPQYSVILRFSGESVTRLCITTVTI